MGTTRISFNAPLPVQIIQSGQGNEFQEFEVPAGETRYHFSQRASGHDTPSDVIIFHLRHPLSRIFFTGLVEARGESTPSLKTVVVHHAPNTQAETIVRTVAFEQTKPHYEGTIRIMREAQEVESYLNHHSLLLGEKARSWTLPCLEIEANQVKCSHAATIRTITDLDLFYLRSRGINAAQARALFIEAFTADVTLA
jgi:Fe-S cluster assembly scaffold protein SufB